MGARVYAAPWPRARVGAAFALLLRRREGVDGAAPLRPEDEGELPFGTQPAVRGPVGGAGLAEVQRAEHVLPEEAVIARGTLRLRHPSCLPLRSSPNGWCPSCSISLARASRDFAKPRLFNLGVVGMPRSFRITLHRLG